MKAALWWSSVGKKFVSALSGIALMLFLVVHLGGNLTLFAGDGGRLFNTYAHHLESLGPLLYAAEAGLLAIFLFHAVSGIQVQLDKWKARPAGYAVSATKGGPSRQTIASRSMIVTGLVLLVFVPLHVWMFKFNGGQPHGMVELHGKSVKNLYASVAAAFESPVIAYGYVAVMALLGFHLRHGFWSALQSLGAMSPRLSPAIYAVGLLFAVAMAGGFLALPLWIHLGACCGAGGAP
jgi:succinate dehydrogenase / fumarate reductase cytochrome b subunit